MYMYMHMYMHMHMYMYMYMYMYIFVFLCGRLNNPSSSSMLPLQYVRKNATDAIGQTFMTLYSARKTAGR